MKSAYKDHSKNLRNMNFLDRWSLYRSLMVKIWSKTLVWMNWWSLNVGGGYKRVYCMSLSFQVTILLGWDLMIKVNCGQSIQNVDFLVSHLVPTLRQIQTLCWHSRKTLFSLMLLRQLMVASTGRVWKMKLIRYYFCFFNFISYSILLKTFWQVFMVADTWF